MLKQFMKYGSFIDQVYYCPYHPIAKIKKYRSDDLTQNLRDVDYIVLSPGISLIKNKNLRKYKSKIITDIDLFFLAGNRPKSIVVTGTNGKSTTCKLIYHLLKKNI